MFSYAGFTHNQIRLFCSLLAVATHLRPSFCAPHRRNHHCDISWGWYSNFVLLYVLKALLTYLRGTYSLMLNLLTLSARIYFGSLTCHVTGIHLSDGRPRIETLNNIESRDSTQALTNWSRLGWSKKKVGNENKANISSLWC
jgi:hypothetical protein